MYTYVFTNAKIFKLKIKYQYKIMIVRRHVYESIIANIPTITKSQLK